MNPVPKLKLAVAVILIIATASFSIAELQASNNLRLHGCERILEMSSSYVRPNDASTPKGKYAYSPSFSNSVDKYRTSWNLLISNHMGTRLSSHQLAYAESLLSGVKGLNLQEYLFWQRLGMMILRSQERLPEGLNNADSYFSAVAARQGSALNADARRIIAVTEILVFGANSKESRRYFSRNKSRLGGSPSIERIEEVALEVRNSGLKSNAVKEFTLLGNAIVREKPSGPGVYVLYLMQNMFGQDINISADLKRTYLKKLKTKFGGLGFTSGEISEPQVTFYGLKLDSPVVGNLNRHLEYLKSGDMWLADLGKMPIGTMVLLEEISNKCLAEKRHKAISQDSLKPPFAGNTIEECLAASYPNIQVNDWKKYLESSEFGRFRQTHLAEACGIKLDVSRQRSQVLGKHDRNADAGAALLAFLESKLGIKKWKSSSYEDLVVDGGCKYSSEVTTVDLYSTAICSAVGLLTKSQTLTILNKFKSLKGISMYAGQQESQMDSPESLLLNFLLSNDIDQVAFELALL